MNSSLDTVVVEIRYDKLLNKVIMNNYLMKMKMTSRWKRQEIPRSRLLSPSGVDYLSELLRRTFLHCPI